jgi:hypothetical protein
MLPLLQLTWFLNPFAQGHYSERSGGYRLLAPVHFGSEAVQQIWAWFEQPACCASYAHQRIGAAARAMPILTRQRSGEQPPIPTAKLCKQAAFL